MRFWGAFALGLGATACGTNGWSIADSALDEDVTIEPGASAERRITWDASHPVHMGAGASPVGSDTKIMGKSGAKLRLAIDDLANGPTPQPPVVSGIAESCEGAVVFIADDRNGWVVEGADPNSAGFRGGFSMGAKCAAKGTLVLRLTNESPEVIRARLSFDGRIGEGNFVNEPPPSDAFLDVKVAP